MALALAKGPWNGKSLWCGRIQNIYPYNIICRKQNDWKSIFCVIKFCDYFTHKCLELIINCYPVHSPLNRNNRETLTALPSQTDILEERERASEFDRKRNVKNLGGKEFECERHDHDVTLTSVGVLPKRKRCCGGMNEGDGMLQNGRSI